MDPLDIYPTTLRTQLKEECKQVHYKLIEEGLPDDPYTNHVVRLALHQLTVNAFNHHITYRDSQAILPTRDFYHE